MARVIAARLPGRLVLGADQTLALRIAVPLSGGDRPIRLAALLSLKEGAGENWGLFVRDQETLVRHRSAWWRSQSYANVSHSAC
jgi:hypothetical protein